MFHSLPDPSPASVFVTDDEVTRFPIFDNMPNYNFSAGNEFTTPEKLDFDFSTMQFAPKKEEKPPCRRKLILPEPIHSNVDSTLVPPTIAPVRPQKERLNGKQMIKRCQHRSCRQRKAPPSSSSSTKTNKAKTEAEEYFALRRMEPFVCILFCGKCQERAHYKHGFFSIEVCERCRELLKEKEM